MSRDPLLDELREMWLRRDPMPPGLIEELKEALAGVAFLADSDLDYELMMLVSRSREVVGARSAAGTSAYTLRFEAEGVDLLVRVSGDADDKARLDCWVVPPEEMSAHATRVDDERRFETEVDEHGRFEFAGMPRGLYRIWLTPAGEGVKPFGTPAFEI